MRRREFIALLGGATTAWPLSVHAQQGSKLPTIGFLGSATPSAWSYWVTAFVQRLRELGWIDQRTVAIKWRWAEGSSERAGALAAELVREKVDVIVTGGTALLAVKQVTSTIPIVFTVVGDPVAGGFVETLAHPGGNLTGLSSQTPDLAGKRIELLREMVPGLHHLAIMANAGYAAVALEMDQVEKAARMFGLDVAPLGIRTRGDILNAFKSLKDPTDALIVLSDGLVNANRIPINTMTLAKRLPTMYGIRECVEIGGLMSYGANYQDLFRRAADYVDKILRGAKPADLPIEQPTAFDLVINGTTAKALGIIVPEKLLALANDVIE